MQEHRRLRRSLLASTYSSLCDLKGRSESSFGSKSHAQSPAPNDRALQISTLERLSSTISNLVPPEPWATMAAERSAEGSAASSSRIQPSLSALRAHSIFVPPPSTSPEDDWELIDDPSTPRLSQKVQRVILRDRDLIVAFGTELRLACLGGDDWTLDSGKLGTYKVRSRPVSSTFAFLNQDVLCCEVLALIWTDSGLSSSEIRDSTTSYQLHWSLISCCRAETAGCSHPSRKSCHWDFVRRDPVQVCGLPYHA